MYSKRVSRNTTRSAVIVACLCVLATATIARADDSLWSDRFAPMGIHGTVNTIVARNSWIYAAGEFEQAGGQVCNNIAYWNGRCWKPLYGGFNAPVNTLLSAEVAILAGGNFTTVDGIAANHVAAFSTPANTWGPMGDGLNDGVHALILDGAAEVAGGEFGGFGPRGVGRFDGITWNDFPADDLLTTGYAYCFAHFRGELWAGGTMLSLDNGSQPGSVAAHNGVEWYRPGSLGPDLYSSDVFCMYPVGDRLYIGGDFDEVDGGDCWYMTYFDDDAGYGVPHGWGAPSPVKAFAEYNGYLLVGHEDGVSRYTAIDGWGDDVGELEDVRSLLTAGGNLYAGGDLDVDGIAIWLDGDWRRMGGGLSSATGNPDYQHVRELIEYDGEIVAAGDVRLTAWPSSGNSMGVGAWNGTYWESIGMDGGLGGYGHALEILDGELIAAGSFTVADTDTVYNIARLEDDEWRHMGGGLPGTNSEVNDLVVWGGQLVAGGYSRVYLGAPACCIVTWDGGDWNPLPSELETGRVHALAEYMGDLIVGGSFRLPGGSSIIGIARFDGSTWHEMAGGVTGLAQTVYSLEVHDGELIVGGSFDTAGSTPANNIASWNGSAWSALGDGVTGSPSGGYTYVHGLRSSDIGVFVSGEFTTAGATAASCVARWDDGVWSTLGSGITGGPGGVTKVHTMLIFDNELYFGGDFSSAGGKLSANMALWRERVSAVPGGDMPRRSGPGVSAYPNPFNPMTRLMIAAPPSGRARLQIFDTRGRLVATLADGVVSDRQTGYVWNGRNTKGAEMPSGMYLARLSWREGSVAEKIMLVR